MDLVATIRQLRKNRDKLDEMIAILRELQQRELAGQASPPARKRRGRKSMGDLERVEVSHRMRAYWARWRAERSGQAANTQF